MKVMKFSEWVIAQHPDFELDEALHTGPSRTERWAANVINQVQTAMGAAHMQFGDKRIGERIQIAIDRSPQVPPNLANKLILHATRGGTQEVADTLRRIKQSAGEKLSAQDLVNKLLHYFSIAMQTAPRDSEMSAGSAAAPVSRASASIPISRAGALAAPSPVARRF